MNEYGNFNDEENLNPLKIALLCDNYDAIQTILNYLKYEIKEKGIMAFCCENNNNDDILKEFLKCKNLNINEKGGSLNETPLNYLIIKNNINQLKLLIKNHDLNVSLTNNNGLSPFCNLLNNKKYDIANLLLEHPKIFLSEKELKHLFNEGNNDVINNVLSKNKINFLQINTNDYFLELIKRSDIDVKLLKNFKNININHYDIYQNTALIYTASNGNIEKMNYILSSFPEIDLTIINEYGMNALMCAVTNSQYVCVNKLLEYIKEKCDEKMTNEIANQINNAKESLILITSKKNNDQLFEILYNSLKFNLNVTDNLGKSALHYSIENKNLLIFDLLIKDESVDINVQDNNGMTPLMYIIKLVNPSLINLTYTEHDKLNYYLFELLKHKNIEINRLNNYGQNALFYLILKKYGKINNLVESKDAYLNNDFSLYPQCLDNIIPTMENCDKKNNDFYENLVTLLLNKSSSINNKDIFDKTILNYIIDNNDMSLFTNILLSNKIDPNLTNDRGKTNLMMLLDKLTNNSDIYGSNEIIETTENQCKNDWFTSAVSLRKTPICIKKEYIGIYDTNYDLLLSFFIQLIKCNNTNINATDYLGNSILMLSSEINSINLLKHILSNKNVNIDLQNYIGETALILSIKKKLWSNAKILIEYGANLELKNYKGLLPKDYLQNEIEIKIFEGIINSKSQNKIESFDNNQSNELKKGWFFN